MAGKGCRECPVKELLELHGILRKRMKAKLPEEVREPLEEARRQMRMAIGGLAGHLLKEDLPADEKLSAPSRPVRVE